MLQSLVPEKKCRNKKLEVNQIEREREIVCLIIVCLRALPTQGGHISTRHIHVFHFRKGSHSHLHKSWVKKFCTGIEKREYNFLNIF